MKIETFDEFIQRPEGVICVLALLAAGYMIGVEFKK